MSQKDSARSHSNEVPKFHWAYKSFTRDICSTTNSVSSIAHVHDQWSQIKLAILFGFLLACIIILSCIPSHMKPLNIMHSLFRLGWRRQSQVWCFVMRLYNIAIDAYAYTIQTKSDASDSKHRRYLLQPKENTNLSIELSCIRLDICRKIKQIASHAHTDARTHDQNARWKLYKEYISYICTFGVGKRHDQEKKKEVQ